MSARALLIAVVLLVPVHGATYAETADDFSAVSRVVETSMEAHGIQGVGLAVFRDYQVVWAASFGIAEPGRPVETDTLFQAASLTKPVSALVAAAAHEEGLIDLEADAFDLIDSWTHPPMPFEGPVTPWMLLAHRGGANVHGFPGYRMDERLPGLPRILDGVRDKNEPIRIYDAPPAPRRYSGGGYLIAQLAIEDHTGRTLEDLADALVFGPLGLKLSTYRHLRSADRHRLAVGYRADGSEVAGGGWHLYPETAPASLWTTPTEYARLVIDVVRSYEQGRGVVLDHETARRLLDPDFAVGFGVSREPNGIAIGHDGANEGYRCRFVALPDLGDGVVVLTNNDNGAALCNDVVAAVAQHLGWPGTGWRTPLWVVLVALAVLALVTWWGLRKLLRRRAV